MKTLYFIVFKLLSASSTYSESDCWGRVLFKNWFKNSFQFALSVSGIDALGSFHRNLQLLASLFDLLISPNEKSQRQSVHFQ